MSLKTIIQDVKDWLNKLVKNMPPALKTAAEVALKYTTPVLAAFQSKTAIVLTTIVPEAEPFREDIIALLEELQKVLTSIDNTDYQEGAVAKAGALITKQVHGATLPQHVYDTAFQELYSAQKIAA